MSLTFADRLSPVLAKANEAEWTGYFPNVHMRLKLALTILGRNAPKFWDLSATELAEHIADFPAIKAQFDIHDDITLAFAIRTMRMQTPASV